MEQAKLVPSEVQRSLQTGVETYSELCSLLYWNGYPNTASILHTAIKRLEQSVVRFSIEDGYKD